MPASSAWGKAIGGIGEFLKLQRGLTQNTEDREMKQREFDSAEKLRGVQTHTGELQNTALEADNAARPDREARDRLKFFADTFDVDNITEEHIQAYVGGDPKRAQEAESIRRSVALAKQMKADDRKLKTTQQQVADLGVQSAQLQLPQVQATAANQAAGWKYLADPANRGKSPISDWGTYQAYQATGQNVELTPQQKQDFALQVARIQAAGSRYNHAEATKAVEDAELAQTLPAGVDLRTAKIVDRLMVPFVTNINNGMKRLENYKLDISGVPNQKPYGDKQGGGNSYQEQQQKQEAIGISDALYKEADDIIVALRKTIGENRAAEEWVRQQQRQYLATVPKYWKGELVTSPNQRSKIPPKTTTTSGSQISQ